MVFTTLFASLAFVQSPATPRPDSARTIYGVEAQGERRVSLRVSDASLKDVLGKLPKVDYVVDADAFKNRRVTLSLSDVPLSRALDAIASALDAHWETQGGIRVLRPGTGLGFGGTAFRSFAMPKDGARLRDFGPIQQKKLEDLRLRFKDAPVFEFRNGADGKPPIFGRRDERKLDSDGLLKSLTPAQKSLSKSQGYLKMSDLTPDQRKMTGIEGDGAFEITITRNGETLKIRN